MMPAPDVTVIIPVYNKSKYLRACIESILCQTGITLEVICVDDCSTDGSWEIAEEITKKESRVRLVRNESNKGAFHSRNVGISLARGRYVQFTDADDLLPADSLSTLVNASKRTDSDVVRGTLQTLHDEVVAPWEGEVINAEKTGTLLDLPELWIPWFHVCFLISRKLLIRKKIQYPNLVAGEDPVFMAKVLTNAQRVCVIPHVAYTYRQDDSRSLPKFKTVQDYITHLKLVKAIYGGIYKPCWLAYQKFIVADVELLLSQAQVTSEEHILLENQINELLIETESNPETQARVAQWEVKIKSFFRRFLNSAFFPMKARRIKKDMALISASVFFDKEWYLSKNPDVAQAKMNPVYHYLKFGGFEGRDPSSTFSSSYYLNKNEDVKKAGVNPLVHYLKYGRDEGRTPNNQNG